MNMKALAALPGMVLMAVALAAAGPAPDLPLPPSPPRHAVEAADAPVPDVDLRAPANNAQRTTVSLEMYRASGFDSSQGFTPGSRFQTSEDRKPIQTPGVSVRIPLK